MISEYIPIIAHSERAQWRAGMGGLGMGYSEYLFQKGSTIQRFHKFTVSFRQSDHVSMTYPHTIAWVYVIDQIIQTTCY
jgi:hypothetical protein